MTYNRYKTWTEIREHWRRRGAAYLVLFISLIPTLIAYKQVLNYAHDRDLERLNQFVQDSRLTFERRLQRHRDALHHLTGLVGTTGFGKDEWNQFFANAAFFKDFPAVRSLAYYRVAAGAQTESSGNLVVTVENSRVVLTPGFRAAASRAFGDVELHVERVSEALTAPLLDRSPVMLLRSELTTTPADDATIVMIDPVLSPAQDGSPDRDLAGVLIATIEPEGLLGKVFLQDPAPMAVRLHTKTEASVMPRSANELEGRFLRPLLIFKAPLALDYEVLKPFFAASAHRLPNIVLLSGLLVNIMLFSIAWLQAQARLRAENLTEDLRSVQERDRMLERATNDAIWDWNIESHQLVWNEAVQAMFRYGADEVKPHLDWWQEKLHPDDRRRVWNGRELAVQTGGEFWADEYRFARGDGSYASVIDRGYIIHDRQGLAIRMIGSMVDITSQKEAEQARAESERKLALHIQRTPLAVIEWDLDFKVTAWNAAAERIFGYKSTEAIGRPGSSLMVHDPEMNPNPFLFSNILAGENFPEDVRRRVNETWQRVLQEAAYEISRNPAGPVAHRSINAFAVSNRTKSGETLICDWYNTPLIDAGGDVVGIASLVLDVTARKEAEDALAAEKERLAVTLRSIGDGVIATDTEGRINLINKQAEELTGWIQSEAMGQPLSKTFNVIDQKTRVTYRNPLSHVLSSGEIVDLPDRSLLVSKEGTEKVIGASAAPIHDQESRIVGAVLVFRDITDEQTIMEERLRASKLDSLGILAGGIAHDFNNILTAVIGNISFARMFAEPGNKQYSRLEEGEKAALRAKDLATQLLTFSKGGTPVRQTASLPELIQDSSAFALRGSNVRCEFDMAEDLHAVEIDQGQFSQVIHNLVINAVQAMPDGGVLRINAENISLDTESNIPLPYGKYAHLILKDHGAGISQDAIQHVFDPYFTTKEKGTGLGLATCYSIVKRHDGLITVESEVGEGTEFHIYLPASDKQILPVTDDNEEPIEGQGRILVMDDEEIIRELAVTSLEFLGYRVDAVEDGETCITSYQAAREKQDPYNVVIMDLTIPGGMGGVEAIQKLRELDPNVTAIVSSGYSSGPVMANYKEHGFKGVVAKPYKVEDLAKALSTLLKNGDSNS